MRETTSRPLNHTVPASQNQAGQSTGIERGSASLRVLPITPTIAVRSYLLDWPKKGSGEQHRDPADRLIVATAMLKGLVLVTEDAEMHRRAPRWRLPILK